MQSPGTNVHLNAHVLEHERVHCRARRCYHVGVGGALQASQNREAHPQFRAHLQGRIAFVEMVNATKGKRLQALLDRVKWE